MEVKSLADLEERIDRIVKIIRDLKMLNENIEEENRGFRLLLSERERQFETLKIENEKLRRRVLPLDQKKEKMRSQIEKMLTRLETANVSSGA
ncbi:MAG TPA: hypothetical protein EYP53_07435 [Candidatus Latescibacteria bacterium]|nr:hypothetical protein [Candidatus Latescibacterota bacterium]